MRAHEHSIEQVHVAMGHAWPGLAQERVGAWVVRLGSGYTGRANSALPVGDPGRGLPAAVDAVEEAYRRYGLPPRFQVPLALGPEAGGTLDAGARPVRGELDALLQERGYAWGTPALVQVAGNDTDGAVRAALAGETHGTTMTWADEPEGPWLSLASERFRSFGAALEVTTAHPARYLTLWLDGEPVGRGRTSRAGSWYDVSDLLVIEGLRGRGLGRRVLAEAMAEGYRLGADYGVLQVETDNTVAQRLYRSMGWRDHGAYHYRTLA